MTDLDASFIIVDGETGRDRYASLTSSPTASTMGTKPPRHPSKEADHASYTPGSSSETYSHDWSRNGTGGRIAIHGRHFVDAYGRVCNLRGVNLSGSCKAPANHDHETFPHKHEDVTFVGRPFPLEEADEHLSRLRRWGLTFVRFLVTWEAIEHEGPGIYDVSYLTYIRDLLSMFPQYGMIAFVSMHQDVWSRYSGGSGAPAWTLEAVGFDLHALEKSGAAWLKGVTGGGHVEEERGIWPCGYQKLAASTMATCFWGGDTFCPKLKIQTKQGETSIQEFLQGCFLNSWDMLVKTVGPLEAVVGFEMMNEPHRGYIELPSLHEFDYNTDLHLSFVPSALQSFLLGDGHPTNVTEWVRSFPMPTRPGQESLLNKDGHSAWRKDGPTQGSCLWQMHGVWGWDLDKKSGVVLRQNYFSKNPTTGEKIDWYTNFYYPFLQKWATRLRNLTSKDKIVFVEAIPNEFCPPSWKPEHQVSNMVYAPHWYDLNALFMKGFGNFTPNVQGLSRGMFPLKAFYWGQKGARDNYALQIRNLTNASYQVLGEKPVIIGECGVPMDMNKKAAFSTGDWRWQARMMDALIVALERAMIGFTLWNYNPDNTEEKGDDWNGENFSWFSRARALSESDLFSSISGSPQPQASSLKVGRSQTTLTLDRGAKILSSVVRPYPAKTAGIPIKFDYELTTGEFTYTWVTPGSSSGNRKPGSSDAAIYASAGTNGVIPPPLANHPPITNQETEIFIPSLLTLGRQLRVEGLDSNNRERFMFDEERQTLFIVTPPNTSDTPLVYTIRVYVTPEIRGEFVANSLAGDLWAWVKPLMMIFMALLAVLAARWVQQ